MKNKLVALVTAFVLAFGVVTVAPAEPALATAGACSHKYGASVHIYSTNFKHQVALLGNYPTYTYVGEKRWFRSSSHGSWIYQGTFAGYCSKL